MKIEEELKTHVTLKDLADFMALALKIASEVGTDPQYKRLLSRIDAHQRASDVPRRTALLSEMLKSIKSPLEKDFLRSTTGRPRAQTNDDL